MSLSKHTHIVELSAAEISQCKGGQDVYKTSSTSNGHEHELRIRYNRATKKFMYRHCDGKSICWDKHTRYLQLLIIKVKLVCNLTHSNKEDILTVDEP